MGRASSLSSRATRGLWEGGGQPNLPLPWVVLLELQGSAVAPRRQRLGPAGGTEVAHTVLGVSPATRKAVVSDSVSNRMRSRIGDRSPAAEGRGAAPRLLGAAPGTAAQREAGTTAPNTVLALGKLGELVSSVRQRDANVGCRQTRERLPFCSQNANRDENAMAMSHGAATLAGERGRGEMGRGRHAGR